MTRRDPSGARVYNFQYDAENHLTAVSGSATASFVYDGDGNRVKNTAGGVTTVHLGAYFEWTGNTSTMKKYYSAGGARVAVRTGASTLSFILTDHLGSTSVTTDSAGALLTDNRYKAWGESRYAGGTLPTKFTYTGQYSNVAEFGLMYYGARWYDSALSRFAQADTIIPQPGNSQAWDRYAYTLNNPLKYTDPTGHDAWWCQTTSCQATHYSKLGYGKKVSGKVINPEKQNRRKDDIPAFEWSESSQSSEGNAQAKSISPPDDLEERGNAGCGGRGCNLGGNNPEDEGVNWVAVVIGAGVIIVGGVFFIVGASATAVAVASLELELAPLAAIGAVAGGLMVYGGIQILNNSGLIPGTKRER